MSRLSELHLLAIAALLATAFAPAFGETAAGSADAGRRAYMKNMCYTCHGTVGQGGERGAGPRLAPNPVPFEGFAQEVRHPRAVMPRYPAQFLSDPDLANIYAYIASIKPGPKAGDISLLKD